MKLCTGSLSKRPKLYQYIRDKCLNISNLETFWTKASVETGIAKLPELWLMCDSGAHSLYNKFIAQYGSRFVADYSWVDESEFRKYLDSYINWLHTYKDKLGAYVTLDVIGNAAKTWEVQKYMESYGLTPLPVFHYGEDKSYLHKYIDNYEYIGIGSIATTADNTSFYDEVYRTVGCENGKVRRKLHGFAATDFKSIIRYPWFSVDSISWVLHGAYGVAMFPKFDTVGWKFEQAIRVKCSKVKSVSSNAIMLREYMMLVGERNVRSYLADAGVEVVDGAIEDALTESINRDKLNLYYFAQLQRVCAQMTEWSVWKSQQLKFV